MRRTKSVFVIGLSYIFLMKFAEVLYLPFRQILGFAFPLFIAFMYPVDNLDLDVVKLIVLNILVGTLVNFNELAGDYTLLVTMKANANPVYVPAWGQFFSDVMLWNPALTVLALYPLTIGLSLAEYVFVNWLIKRTGFRKRLAHIHGGT